MQLRLEFLHSDGDIEEFINFLYDNGLFISHCCREMRGIVLDRLIAIHELQHDLHSVGGSGYYVGDKTNSRILTMDSCGSQSHPSKLGREGRLAGVIGHVDKENERANELMRQLRNYFRRNYKFQRYNGAARMSCHFGPHYRRMEADFFCDPRVEDLCCGYLCLVCPADRVELEKDRITNVLNRLDVQNVKISMYPYWMNPSLVQLDVPFLYYAPSFSSEAYSSVISELSFDGKIRFLSTNLRYFFRNNFLPGDLMNHSQANCIDLLLHRPW